MKLKNVPNIMLVAGQRHCPIMGYPEWSLSWFPCKRMQYVAKGHMTERNSPSSLNETIKEFIESFRFGLLHDYNPGAIDANTRYLSIQVNRTKIEFEWYYKAPEELIEVQLVWDDMAATLDSVFRSK